MWAQEYYCLLFAIAPNWKQAKLKPKCIDRKLEKENCGIGTVEYQTANQMISVHTEEHSFKIHEKTLKAKC